MAARSSICAEEAGFMMAERSPSSRPASRRCHCSLFARAGAAAICVAMLAVLGACTEEVGTSIRISLVYKDSWRISSADVVATEAEKNTPISREMLVLVPDEAAGEVMPIEVWGVREGERIAHGAAVALPRKGATVGATIVLERLPCGAFCEPGELRCDAGGVETCEPNGDDCLQWSEPQACPSETPYCSAGECRVDCADECAAGEGTCVDAATQRRCGQFDTDSCRDFSASEPCGNGQLCYGGRCAAPCAYAGALAHTSISGTANGRDPGAVIDAAGAIHAVYAAADRALFYLAKPRGGAWSSPVALGASGDTPTLALDAAGKLHVAFFNGGLRYGARDLGGAWSFRDVQLGATIGQSHAIAVDAAGTVHIVYQDFTAKLLRHAAGSIDGFTLVTADTMLGYRCDLVITGLTLHVVSYSDANNLWYSTKTGAGAWSSVIVDDLVDPDLSPQARASIAVDRTNTLHVAYSDIYDTTTTSNWLLYTSRAMGGTWRSPTIVDSAGGNTGGYPDVAVDLFDGVHVAYRTTDAASNLRYAYKPSGVTAPWQLTPQPAAATVQEPSIVVDSAGVVRMISSARPGALVETTRACQ
jgi:hypothetical protein